MEAGLMEIVQFLYRSWVVRSAFMGLFMGGKPEGNIRGGNVWIPSCSTMLVSCYWISIPLVLQPLCSCNGRSCLGVLQVLWCCGVLMIRCTSFSGSLTSIISGVWLIVHDLTAVTHFPWYSLMPFSLPNLLTIIISGILLIVLDFKAVTLISSALRMPFLLNVLDLIAATVIPWRSLFLFYLQYLLTVVSSRVLSVVLDLGDIALVS